MLKRSQKLFLLLFISLALIGRVDAQVLDYQSRVAMERDTIHTLLEKDVGEVANQLARERATTVAPLVRHLTIFARAGHRSRVLQTLNRLAAASDMPPLSHRLAVAEAIRQIIGVDDLAALKTFYERIMPSDAHTAENLLRLWEKEGDTKELDSWLADRAKQHYEWIRWRIYWRTKLGTAGELLDAFAARLKANPDDRLLLHLYLEASASASGPRRNVSWLADVLSLPTAYESYELAMRLKTYAPAGAAKLLERSLLQPFTEKDMQLINDRVIPRYSMPPPIKNWDKQLRFWTKVSLAELYQTLGQSKAAQLIVEELVAIKSDDIVREDVYSLAGAVQAQSGMRVVEATILQNEAAERESASYWTERARYYIGRKEFDAAMETHRTALARLPFKPKDEDSVRARLNLLKEFAIFAAPRTTDGKSLERRAELEQLLWREFNAASPETSYAFGVALIISDHEFEFDGLMDSLFVSQMNVPARMLAARETWTNLEASLIDNIVCRSTLTPEQRANYWTQFEALTKNGSPSRGYYLADIMVSCTAANRAIPLLVGYRERVRGLSDEMSDAGEWQTVDKLLTVYLYTDDWRSAEKLLFENEALRRNQIIYDLLQISLAAGRAGDVNDAVRLWRTKSNLDRRYLEGLDKLAATPAKEPLRRFYTEMKKKDPLSSVPDIALKALN